VTKEDFGIVKRQQFTSKMAAQRKAAAELAKVAASQAALAPKSTAEDVTMTDGEKATGSDSKDETHPSQTLSVPASSQPPPATEDVNQLSLASVQPTATAPRQPWELVDEIMNNMKSSFPLLSLTMEKMVDQITMRAKPASDEDIYRFFAALLADAMHVSLSCGHGDIL
jgi:transformation/transcription domain-associated protein